MWLLISIVCHSLQSHLDHLACVYTQKCTNKTELTFIMSFAQVGYDEIGQFPSKVLHFRAATNIYVIITFTILIN